MKKTEKMLLKSLCELEYEFGDLENPIDGKRVVGDDFIERWNKFDLSKILIETYGIKEEETDELYDLLEKLDTRELTPEQFVSTFESQYGL